ncbi:hypothetical protein KIN20_020436 [Parelaphostrongylus tenuis]|uniref:Uncharacterized protein n=1 Tax=Parelaphostrongylus tenuis TaxID=148309 RepID=A0AAD5MMG0_PARTN|nr:hypothetical protein KIN20_020436 [Parelaphostrongylus tenuis]
MQEKLRKGERRAVQNRNGVMVLNGSTREKCRRFQQHTVRVNSGTKKFGVAESYNNNMGRSTNIAFLGNLKRLRSKNQNLHKNGETLDRPHYKFAAGHSLDSVWMWSVAWRPSEHEGLQCHRLQNFAHTYGIQTVEHQGRSSFLPDSVTYLILSQLTVTVDYEPFLCEKAVTPDDTNTIEDEFYCIIVGNTFTGDCIPLYNGTPCGIRTQH